VVIGCLDSFSLVNGRGKQKLLDAGVRVESGILEKECLYLNRRFFTFHEKKRPYLILKWAETADGFIDKIRSPDSGENALQISGNESQQLLHKWRSEESAILIGTNTALQDNPRLTVRGVTGRNPLRIALDRQNIIPASSSIKDKSTPTIIFTSVLPKRTQASSNLEYIQLSFINSTETLVDLLAELYERKIQSVLVEGGAKLLNSFFESGIWDEARVFVSKKTIGEGVSAPDLPAHPSITEVIGEDQLQIYLNTDNKNNRDL
jgi:diaminohydroxyphosphoribosylaminopyrimidine deaminase/5-amino-6-(5-phosphoribosylamino)uracil reductase